MKCSHLAVEVLTAAVVQQINDNGEFLIDPPACSIKESTAQAVATASSVALTSNEENYDNDSMHLTASLTSQITIQTAGRYNVWAAVMFNTDGTSRTVWFRVNNTSTDYIFQGSPPLASNWVTTGSRTLVLSAGDYVELFISHTKGSDLDVTMLEFGALFLTR